MRHSGKDAVTICLNIDEGRIIFEALAEQPFKYVYELIGKINRQANAGTAGCGDAKTLHAYTLSRQEMDLLIRALGEMPFNRVHALVANLNTQILAQLTD